jgi:hypothetical protein
MRFAIAVALALVAGASTINAQTTKPPKPPKTITLSGCVERGDGKPDEFTLTDAKAKKKYRLTGADFREYVGRRVQIDGGVVVKGVRISGGLQPNPNVAAQAGALDPSRAAVQAATSGSSTGPTPDVEEFKVKTIRSAGACE